MWENRPEIISEVVSTERLNILKGKNFGVFGGGLTGNLWGPYRLATCRLVQLFLPLHGKGEMRRRRVDVLLRDRDRGVAHESFDLEGLSPGFGEVGAEGMATGVEHELPFRKFIRMLREEVQVPLVERFPLEVSVAAWEEPFGPGVERAQQVVGGTRSSGVRNRPDSIFRFAREDLDAIVGDVGLAQANQLQRTQAPVEDEDRGTAQRFRSQFQIGLLHLW